MKRLGIIFLLAAGMVNVKAQITIDAAQTYQTIEGFAASDCWTTHYVGKYWNDDKKELAAKWLFSQNLKSDGSPEGIGLSMWRVNLGAGSMEQGDDSGIEDIARRGECFLDADGNYDWSKQEGQQWFMNRAKEYGCEKFVLFSNSPLVGYTLNGKAFAPAGGNANLQSDKYDDFSEYLATVVQHFTQEGFNIPYISPVNEPQWDWKDGGQEGSPWRNEEIKKLTVELDKSIQAKELDAKILIAEAGDYTYLYSNTGHRSGNQIQQFFDSKSANYVGNLPSVANIIAGHSYWTHGTNAQLRDTRSSVKSKADTYHTGVFQTEWSLLGENPGENFPGYDAASYMDIALIMARVIHSDLAYAGASSWSYWTAMGQEMWDHKDRFLLLSLAPGNPSGAYNLITQSGMIYDRSTLWALGNYSFFVRPGYQRIQLDGANNLAGLMGTAYMAPDRSKIVAVYVNMASEAQKIRTGFVNLSGFVPVKNRVYVTNSSYNLRKTGSASSEEYDAGREISVPARSVVSVVYELETASGVVRPDAERIQICPNPAVKGGKIRINLPGISENITFSIFSGNGKLLFSEKRKNLLLSETLALPAGLGGGSYILKVKTEKNYFANKLIINN
ncbi:MAG: T9SS type A sorting domain-containing protein [Dysgonamonadaceae bacterium]|jgi:O-glycosyl hydrolase|nr:T9SS type A sorting domain-containing protein [Dysgonamonadaceae bacterium]